MASPPPTPISTARLLLEPIEAGHEEGLLQAILASRTELLPWMPWAKAPAIEGVRAQVEEDRRSWRDDTAFSFAVLENDTRAVLGVVGLNRDSPSEADLHYWIRSDRAGLGLTTEACGALIEWARSGLELERLTLWAGTQNSASRRVAEKLGLRHLGPLEWQPEGGLGPFPAERYELRLTR